MQTEIAEAGKVREISRNMLTNPLQARLLVKAFPSSLGKSAESNAVVYTDINNRIISWGTILMNLAKINRIM